MFINPNFISKNLEIYSKNHDLSQRFFLRLSHDLHKMRNFCDLRNLGTGPVVKLYANKFKLIQNGYLFTRQCKWFVSLKCHTSLPLNPCPLQVMGWRHMTFQTSSSSRFHISLSNKR